MNTKQIEFSTKITLTLGHDGWRGVDHDTGHRTRAYDSMIELNAAICDGTADWTLR